MNKLIITLFLCTLCVVTAQAYSEESMHVEQQLITAQEVIGEFTAKNIPNQRYNDTLLTAWQLFNAQQALEDLNRPSNYGGVTDKLNELELIRKKAFLVADELFLLNNEYFNTQTQYTDAYAYYLRANESYNAQLFEDALQYIELAYQSISEQEALETKLVAMYGATSRGLRAVLMVYYKELIALVILAVVFYVLFADYLRHLSLEKNITHLKHKLHVIQTLIGNSQKEYFENNTLSEAKYKIRLEVYRHKIRDINRLILLRQEKSNMLKQNVVVKMKGLLKRKKSE